MTTHALPATGSFASVPGRVRHEAHALSGARLFLFCVLVSIFTLEYSTYLIRSVSLDIALKLGSLGLLLIGFPYYLPPVRVWRTVLLYALLFGTALLGSASVLDPIGLLQAVKLGICFMIIPVVVLRFRSRDPVPAGLITTPLYWGVFFGLQGMTLFTCVSLLNYVPPSEIVTVARLQDMTERSFGILGYGNTLTMLQTGEHTIRPQGWMLEPSNLSSFMLYPMFVSFGFYRSTKKLRYLLMLLASVAGWASALSLAGFFAAAAAAFVLGFIRSSRKRRATPKWMRIVGPVVAALLFVVVAQKSWTLLTEFGGYRTTPTRTEYLLGRGQDPQIGGLMRNTWHLERAIDLIKINPLGSGLGGTLGKADDTSANALIFWMFAGGVPAVLVLVVLFWHLFNEYCYPLLASRVPVYRGVAAGFIAISVHGLSYGHWMNPFYLLTIAIMILCANHLAVTSSGGAGVPARP